MTKKIHQISGQGIKKKIEKCESEKTKGDLSMALLEYATVSDKGIPVCKLAYITEGDPPSL